MLPRQASNDDVVVGGGAIGGLRCRFATGRLVVFASEP